MVQPPDVMTLMEQDVAPLPLRQRGRQVNLRPKQPQHKGRADVVRQIHTLFQRHRSYQPPAQAEQGHHTVNHHGNRTRQPDDGGDGYRRLQGIGHSLLLPLRQSLRAQTVAF